MSEGGLLLTNWSTFLTVHGTVDLALGANGELLAFQNEYANPAEVIAIALDTGMQTYAYRDLTSPGGHFADVVGFGVSADGEMFGADFSQEECFFKMDPQSGGQCLPVPRVPGTLAPLNIAPELSGTLLLGAAGGLTRFDRGTGVLEKLADGVYPEVEVVPVPEPATAVLTTLGLTLLTIRTWRKS